MSQYRIKVKAEGEQSVCTRDVGEEWTDYSPWHASSLKLQIKELRGFPLGDHQTRPLLQTLKDAELERRTTHIVPSSDASKDVLNQAAKKMTDDEFLAFLCEIEMNEVENNCKKYSAADFYLLIEDEEETILDELGARTHLQKLKLVICFKRQLLCRPTHYPCIPVIEFMKTYGYKDYIVYIEENEIDAELFMKASPETLLEIGFAPNHSRTLPTLFSSWIQRDLHETLPENADADVVSHFLSQNEKLRQYIDKFKESHVDKNLLCKATSEDLKVFGVDTTLDRLRILTGFPRWLEKKNPEYTTHSVVEFLVKSKYEEYSQVFEDNDINGDIIRKATTNELEQVLWDIGIRNKLVSKVLSRKLKATFA